MTTNSKAAVRAWCAILLLSACGGDAADPAANALADRGIVITTAADADALLPPLVATTAGKQVMDLLFDHLAVPRDAQVRTDGDAGFVPRLASSWQWSPDSLSIAFTVHEAARWHDGTPVTARDVQFSHALYTDPVVGSIHARGFDGIDSVSVRDDRTAVVWWSQRHPEQFFQFVYNLSIMPAHLLERVPRDSLASSAFASAPVGSGRYRFGQWERKRQIVLVADSANYRGAPRLARVIWTVAPDPNSATMALLAGQADVLEVLRGDAVTRVGADSTLRTVDYGSFDYGYLIFNLQSSRPSAVSFAERDLRLALTMAVDRAAVVQNALDSLGRVALGPFTRAMPTVDSAMRTIAFDSAGASRMLDSLGWVWNADRSVRMKNGRPLAFDILLPASSGTRRTLGTLLQAQFAAIGARVEIDAVDPAVFAARLRQGDFHTALNAWRSDPSPASIRQSWGSPRSDDVGANFGRYASAPFDALVDSASASFDAEQRITLFRRAYQQIVDDAPAIWLYEPRNLAAVRAHLVPTGMRADAWLAGLADWQVR